ncbi:MAG: bacterial Ig-like domain-containing protein, partial [Clostridiales bacterium]|nr:bacterial Ig-like domain-containing protein [Clostridiales bacterium]
ITCYASFAPIDFTKTGARAVEIDVYLRGVDGAPERVSFIVNVQSQVKIEATDRAVFAGGTAYAPDLFRITENGQAVETTHAMIEGKADTFTPGVYTLTATYKNVSAQATVTVYPAAMKGTYVTKLTTIPDKGSNYDEEEGEDEAPAPVRVLGALVIADDGSITVDGKAATNVTGIDENTLGLTLFGSFAYTLYYENGIAVLCPVNPNKISFNNSNRPMVYFAESVYTVGAYVTVNYTTQHVLHDVMPAYSIDTFCLTAKADGKELWYGLKTQLVRRTSSDTEYAVTWGEATFSEGFRPVTGVSAAVAFGGATYNFTMTSASVGKVDRDTAVKKYPNRTFRGTVDGKTAVLTTDSAERYTLTVNGETVVSAWGNESDIANDMVRGGCNYVTNEVRLNSFRGGEKGVFSYLFTLDPQNNTFTYKARDSYFGKYACGNMYIFLDGYGSGCMVFDSTGFARTELRYDVGGNELHISFADVLSDFAYGNTVTFYISPLYNVLTVKESAPALSEKTFTMLPELVSDGAIVTLQTYTFVASSNAPLELLNALTILDKNGEWSLEKKLSDVDMKTMQNSEIPGFYKITVSVQVGGKEVTQVFAVQLVAA